MIFLNLLICLVIFMAIGWVSRRRSSLHEPLRAEDPILQLLTGMAVLSLLYFGLAVTGAFRGRIIAATTALLALLLWILNGRSIPGKRDLIAMIAVPVFCSLFAVLLFRITPPYEALLRGDDASVYSAAAAQLATSGGLSYHDSLVLDMTAQEREVFFRNRYREDWTGPLTRFPGGVRLTDPDRGTIYFPFYHMAPVWLAFAIKVFGLIHYSLWLSLISTCGLLMLFFLGRNLGGTAVGVMLPVVLFLFYPQQYFSRFPLSEPFAQLFFLGGLLILTRAVERAEGPQPAELHTAGLLWGVSFLCRVDLIYLIALFFLICLPCVPLFSRDRRRWLPMLRILAVCALAAALNQLAAVEYISLFTNSDTLAHNALTDLELGVITMASRFVSSHPAASGLLFLGFAIAILVVPFPTRIPAKRRLAPWLHVLLTSIAAAIMLFPIIGIPSLTLLTHHGGWFVPYAPPAFWALLAAGAVFLAFRERSRPSVKICMILFLLTCAYLFRPLILPGQPWSMRRFVPMLLPLLFLLGLSGWNRALMMASKSGPAVRAAIFWVAAGISALLLYSKSEYLLKEPLYAGVFSSCDALAAKIPHGALVLIPDAMAVLHLELPLRYRNGIDTLMLPLDYKSGRLLSATVRNYLSSRMQKRPVILLSSRGTDLLYPLWKYYWPVPAGSVPFSILLVPHFGPYQYPWKTQRMNFNVSLYALSSQAPPPLPGNTISYDDPRVTFLHFYEEEKGFRWTRDNSIVTGFVYPAGGKDVELLIDIGPLPPGFEIGHPDVTVVINYEVTAQFVKGEGHTLHYLLKGGAADEIHAISLHTKTFREPTGPSPLRDLGISFVRLTFH